MEVRKITFKELYEEHTPKKPTASQQFLDEVGKLTEKSVSTVRQWLYGTKKCPALEKKVIAMHFNVDVNSLFPESDGSDNNNNRDA